MPLGIQGKSLPRAFLPVPPPSLACPQVRPRLSGHARNMRILPALGLVMKAWSSAGSGDLISLPRGLLPRQWNFLLWLIVTSRACLFFFFLHAEGERSTFLGSGESLAWWQNQVQEGKTQQAEEAQPDHFIVPKPCPRIRALTVPTTTPTNPAAELGVQSWVLFRALLESTVCCACRE